MTTSNDHPSQQNDTPKNGLTIGKNTQLFVLGLATFMISSWLAYLCASSASKEVTFLVVWLGFASVITGIGSVIFLGCSIGKYFE